MCVWVSAYACGIQSPNLGFFHHSLLYVWRQSLCLNLQLLDYAKLFEQWTLGSLLFNFPSPKIIGTYHHPTPGIYAFCGEQTQIFTLVPRALSPLSHCPSPETDSLMNEFQASTCRQTVQNCVSRLPWDKAWAFDMFRSWLPLLPWLWHEHFQCFLNRINIFMFIDRLVKRKLSVFPIIFPNFSRWHRHKPGSPTVGLLGTMSKWSPTVATTVVSDW